MSLIQIDLAKTLGSMKPMHAGGQPPLSGASDVYFHYLTEAGIPYSRLHDVGGVFGGNRFVDIPNVFRDFDADETDPANYDFTFTDILISSLIKAGVEPYYRLGVTIENQAEIKAYHTVPPKDYEKWARICEHVIRHYTEGWADGFRYKITYWEIWNEPDVQNQMMWNGTREQFYQLYDVASKHLKACFPHLKIGGYASCGFYGILAEDPSQIPPETQLQTDYFLGFFDYIKEHNCPIDFFSWHSYASVQDTLKMERYLHDELNRRGYGALETHINEWNPSAWEYGTAPHSAKIAAMMIAMQSRDPKLLCIYDMRTNTAPYCPIFDIRTHKPIHGYYSMVAFNALYKLGSQVALDCDTPELYALAASNGTHHALLISNLTGERQALNISGVDLANARFHVIDQERLLSWSPAVSKIEKDEVLLIEW